MLRLLSLSLLGIFTCQLFAADAAREGSSTEASAANYINHYAAVVDFECGNTLVLESVADFQAGDSILIIQMVGAVTDLATEGLDADGTVIEIRGSGLYEYNYIISIDPEARSVVLGRIRRTGYNLNGKVQVVSVPYLGDLVPVGALTCPPWNEASGTGGVLAFSGGRLTLAGSINASGKGFPGGGVNEFSEDDHCGGSDFLYFPESNNRESEKGRGISTIPFAFRRGRGAVANCGGGGDPHNCGGGGGANWGRGGNGGRRISGQACTNAIGGHALNALSWLGQRLFMGGGGGGTHSNNNEGKPGGPGGGIIFIKAISLDPGGQAVRCIKANGVSVQGNAHNQDGGGGGGAGGTILLQLSNQTQTLFVQAKGAKGVEVEQNHGAGGGGGGGVILTNRPFPGVSINNTSGGAAGDNNSSTDGGQRPGERGILDENFILPTRANFIPLALLDYTVIAGCDSSSTVRFEAFGTDLSVSLGGIPLTLIEAQAFANVRSGIHALVVTNGCDTITEPVTVINYPMLQSRTVLLEPFICERPGTWEVQAVGGKAPFTFSLNGGAPVSNGYFAGLTEGIYTVSITDDLGCEEFDTEMVEDSSYVIEVLFPEFIIESRSSTFPLPDSVYTPYPPLAYRWSSPERFMFPDAADPGIHPAEFNYDITLAVVDAVGCTGENSLTVLLEDPPFYFPTGIRLGIEGPDGAFGMFVNPNLEGEILGAQVMDRWGGRVWQIGENVGRFSNRDTSRLNGLDAVLPVTEATRLWDGTVQGKPAPTGVYVFTVLVRLEGSKLFNLKGSFTLLR